MLLQQKTEDTIQISKAAIDPKTIAFAELFIKKTKENLVQASPGKDSEKIE